MKCAGISRRFLFIAVLGVVHSLSWSQENNDIGYDYIAEGDPQLGSLVTRYYQPTDEEDEKLRGMSRASYEAWIARAKSYLHELDTTIDYDALDVAGQVDFDYFHAQLDNSILMLEDLRRWENSPAMYVPFEAFFSPSLDLERPWEERFVEMIAGLESDLFMFSRGKENLKNPPLLWTERAIESCKYVSLYLNTSLPDIIDRAPTDALKDRMIAAAEKYRAALEDYQKFLETDLKPRSTGTYAVRTLGFLKKQPGKLTLIKPGISCCGKTGSITLPPGNSSTISNGRKTGLRRLSMTRW
jgi:hypothetical protein